MKIYSGCLLLLGAVGSVEAFQAPIQGNNAVPAASSRTKLESAPKNWKPQVPGNRNTPTVQKKGNLKRYQPGQELATPTHSKAQNAAYKELKAAERRALEMSGVPSFLVSARMGIPTFKDDITTPRMPGIGSSIPSFTSAAAKYSSAGLAGIPSYFAEVSGSTCPPPRERSMSQFKVSKSVHRHKPGSKPAGIPSYSDLSALRPSGGDPLAGPSPAPPARTGPRVVRKTRTAPASSVVKEPARTAKPAFTAPPKAAAVPAAAAPPKAASAPPKGAAPPKAAGIPSYTQNLSGAPPAGAGKPSYSPFGGAKPKAASASDSLYSPPPVAAEAPAKGFLTPPPPPAAPAAPAVEKKSFAPFGGAKPAAPEPAAAAPTAGAGIPSYTGSLGGGAPAGAGKPSYSPFGGAKPKAASSDSLYAPPAGGVAQAAPAAPAPAARRPVDDRIRGAYEQWCQTHNKQFDEDRLYVFEERFMQAVKHYKETGTAVELNAYADLTPEEYSAQFPGSS